MTFEEALKYLREGKKIKKVDEVFDFLPISLDTLNEDGYKLYTCDLNSGWEVVNEPLLTEEEKEYLKMIIKFHPKEIYNVVVCFRKDYKLVYLQYEIENEYVGCKGDRPLDYDCYVTRKDYFNNLKSDKEYTLEELGLND